MKETHRSLMRSGMGALLLMLLLLTACVGEELQKPLLGEGEGYLTLQIGAISAEVTSSTLTKATLENLPASADFAITIKDANNTEVKHYEKLSQIENPLVLKAGVTYTVEASHGKNEALQDTPYFFDSKKVTIQANTNNPVSLKPSLGNAMLTPVVSNNLSKHYKDYSVTAEVNGITLPFLSGKSLFATAGSTISLIFEGTNKLGVLTSHTWTAEETVLKGKNYLLQCDPKFSECSSIQVNATIDPIIENGWLNGSNVSLSYSLPDGAKIDSITAWHVDVHYNNNGIDNIIRTYEGVAPNATIMDQDSNWPYVPKGSEITAYVVIEGDHIPVKTSKTVNPIPSEVIEITGTTSYDLYLAEDISGANGMDAETIKNIGATAKIDAALLSKFEYSFSLTYDNKVHSNGTSKIDVGTKTGQSWGNHPITATMVFDGQTIQAKKDCHVTGLPYTLKHPANTGNNPWYIIKGTYIKFTDTYILLKTDHPQPTVRSSAFHIPDNKLDFQLYCSYHKNVKSRLNSYTFYVELLNPTDNNSNGTICSHTGKEIGDYTLSGNGTFDTFYSAISCRYGYSALGNDCNVNSISINYR